jgi:hypothetical protein
MEGVLCKALVDTGSQITTVSETFVKKFLPHCEILPISNLKVLGAGANIVQYCGYIEVELKTESDWSCNVPVLVVNSSYSKDVPVVIGTNIVSSYYKDSVKSVPCLSPAWTMAFQAMSKVEDLNDMLGHVRSTKVEIIPPCSKVVIKGLTRAAAGINHHSIVGVTEPVCDQILPGGLLVTPSLVNVGGAVSTYRMSIEISNVSNKHVTIPAKFPLCELHKVDIDPIANDQNSCESQSDDFLNRFKLPDNPEHKFALKSLIQKWKHVFAWDDLECGHTSNVEHRIELNNEIPIKLRYRRIAPCMYNELRQHLKDLLQAGHIRPSKSPWSFPLVLIRKKDKSLRVCINYRELNKRTIRDAYSLPRIDETMDLLSGSSLFSCMDMKQGYYQVGVAEEHKERTAFSAGPLGFYEFNSMPFGLTNSPATFQRMIETCMGDLNLNQCLVFLDDIIVFSSTLDEHISRLESVFDRLSKAGLKLKPSKCDFFKSEVRYLGHIVTSEGVKTDPEKFESVNNWPIPTSINDIQLFIDFSGFIVALLKIIARLPVLSTVC